MPFIKNCEIALKNGPSETVRTLGNNRICKVEAGRLLAARLPSSSPCFSPCQPASELEELCKPNCLPRAIISWRCGPPKTGIAFVCVRLTGCSVCVATQFLYVATTIYCEAPVCFTQLLGANCSCHTDSVVGLALQAP